MRVVLLWIGVIQIEIDWLINDVNKYHSVSFTNLLTKHETATLQQKSAYKDTQLECACTIQSWEHWESSYFQMSTVNINHISLVKACLHGVGIGIKHPLSLSWSVHSAWGAVFGACMCLSPSPVFSFHAALAWAYRQVSFFSPDIVVLGQQHSESFLLDSAVCQACSELLTYIHILIH